jgi:hypothetical protein
VREILLAIDFHLIPYYGEPTPSPLEAPYIYRSQAQNGTCSFSAYSTVYVIKKNKRVTLFRQFFPKHPLINLWQVPSHRIIFYPIT